MRYAHIAIGSLGLLLLAAILAPAGVADVSTVMPVKAAKTPPVCKEVVRCKTCRPVYRCRSCRKRPICNHGICHYRTLCGWGPALNALPKGALVVRAW